LPATNSATPGVNVTARRRTWAEPAPWLRADSLVLALGLAVAGIPLVLSRL